MKRIYVFLLPLLLLLITSTRDSFATTRISITGNGEGSHASVNVEEHIESTHESSSNIRTDIKITTNGEVKEYHSDTPGSVTIESTNGEAKVHVDNSASSSSTPTIIQTSAKSLVSVHVEGGSTSAKVIQKITTINDGNTTEFEKTFEKDEDSTLEDFFSKISKAVTDIFSL